LNVNKRRTFFRKLKEKTNSKNFEELARKLGVNYKTLKLWIAGKRSIPESVMKKCEKLLGHTVKIERLGARKIDLTEVLKRASKEGIKKLESKYGKEWAKILGRLGRNKLAKLLKEDSKLHKRWRCSIKEALLRKFGPNAYKVIGQKGGEAFILNVNHDVLKKRLKKAFRNSIYKFRVKVRGFRLRSMKEAEVLNLLLSKHIFFK
jgi:transcriptional regulator with XRE-family HTH domain